jgi:hypothetical protein
MACVCCRFNNNMPQYPSHVLTHIKLIPVRAGFTTETPEHLIRNAIHYCQSIGEDCFRQQIDQRHGIQLGQMD